MSKKSVLITGCSEGGIGYALAESFQKRGLHVFATARSLEKMSNLADLPNVRLLTLDVTSKASIAAAFRAVESSTGGRLDYLINNSGVSYVAPTLDVDMPTAKAMFDVNFWGMLAMTQTFAPLVINAKGCVANLGSISGFLNSPWQSVYGASKAAVLLMTETMRLELAPLGVNVVTVIVGIVETKLMKNGGYDPIPRTSRYIGVESFIEARARGDEVLKRMKPAAFADKVVGDLLKGAEGLIWRGEIATTVRLSIWLLPRSTMDSMLIPKTGLDILMKEKHMQPSKAAEEQGKNDILRSSP